MGQKIALTPSGQELNEIEELDLLMLQLSLGRES
jgi:hypothetical protein